MGLVFPLKKPNHNTVLGEESDSSSALELWTCYLQGLPTAASKKHTRPSSSTIQTWMLGHFGRREPRSPFTSEKLRLKDCQGWATSRLDCRGAGKVEQERRKRKGQWKQEWPCAPVIFAFLKGDLPRDLPPDGAGDLPLAAVRHAGCTEPGRSPSTAPGAVSHLPSEAAAHRGLQTGRALQGERQTHQPFLEQRGHSREQSGSPQTTVLSVL